MTGAAAAIVPPLMAGTRVINSDRRRLRGYGLGDDEMDHAICTIGWTTHGMPRHARPPVQR
jgi:hypothetical protein